MCESASCPVRALKNTMAIVPSSAISTCGVRPIAVSKYD